MAALAGATEPAVDSGTVPVSLRLGSSKVVPWPSGPVPDEDATVGAPIRTVAPSDFETCRASGALFEMVNEQATRGWDSSFDDFGTIGKSRILSALNATYPDASSSEGRSWTINVPLLQREVRESMQFDQSIRTCTAVLEYQLPMELRRPDAVLLVRGGVVVLELKGERDANDAAIDQAHAYARDLMNYHKCCHELAVQPVVVPTRMVGPERFERDVHVCPPGELDDLIRRFDERDGHRIEAGEFLSATAYKPLPSLVTAARKLFFEKRPPQLWRSIVNTDDAVNTIERIIGQARTTRTRHLVLLTGVPGAGKTLVGLRIAHSPQSSVSGGGDSTPNAIFLSGNGPLVEVLQHVLESKAFVRPVKLYVNRLRNRRSLLPDENVVIFDEAQRAHDAERVKKVHRSEDGKTEPDLLIEFAERRDDWSVVVGLIGGGQEIHVGEEGGLELWMHALRASPSTAAWRVHGPKRLASRFGELDFTSYESLHLEESIRPHLATELHDFVGSLLECRPDPEETLRPVAGRLQRAGHHLRITRSLDQAKRYLRKRYSDHPEARYGLVASSRDKDLEPKFGVPNGWQATRIVKYGPWYNDAEGDQGDRSCRHLTTCVTEFGAQGLELDAALVAWGTDFLLRDGCWSNSRARGYRPPRPKDPWQLRANAYRVLLTRGRDAHVVFVPELSCMDETYDYLVGCGFLELET